MNDKTESWCSFQSKNPDSFDGTTLGPAIENNGFLFNRLYKAFSDGWTAGQLKQHETLKQRALEALFGNTNP